MTPLLLSFRNAKKFLCAALGVMLLASVAIAQNATISGKATDNAGKGLVGATVQATDTETGDRSGAVSGAGGLYRISNVRSGTYTIKASFIGYKAETQTVSLVEAQQVTIDFSLSEGSVRASEVVVTGIASQREKGVAEVSVSRIDAAALTQSNTYQDISQLMSGKVAGVRIAPSSGNVGSGIRFDVRGGAGLFGSGQPIIYIDGVRINNDEFTGFGVGGQGVGALADINPEDIESIDVLKGPAASALYGTSGANGVVLIKTKQGSRIGGTGTFSVQYKNTTGVNTQAKKYTEDMVMSYEDANRIFQTGGLSEHSLSISGIGGGLNYFTSFERRNEEGIIRNNKMDRNSIRANLNTSPAEKLTMKISGNYIYNNISRPQNDNNILGYLGNTLLYAPKAGGSYQFTDSAAIEAISDFTRSRRFIGSVEFNSTHIDNLLLRATVGFDAQDIRNDQTFPSNMIYQGTASGERNIRNDNRNQYNFDVNASYNYGITDELKATSTVAGQGFLTTFRSFNVTKQTYASELISNIGSGTLFIGADEEFTDAREAGLILAQDLSFKETYFFSAGFRSDYSTRFFNEDAFTIGYPRASGAVRLDRLDLVDFNSAGFNLVKLRMGYGTSGVLPGRNDASDIIWAGTLSGAGTGAIINFVGTPSIKPESIGEFEIGLEAEYENRHGMEVTYYETKATNSIVTFNAAPSTGFISNTIPKNVGKIKGWGVEANMYTAPLKTENYGVDLNLTWNFTDNVVEDAGGVEIPDAFSRNWIVKGERRSSFYMFKILGARYDTTGKYLGPLRDTKRSYIGTPVPVHSGSFSTSFRMYNFTFNALFDWGMGHSIFNSTRWFSTGSANLNNKEWNYYAALVGRRVDSSVAIPLPVSSTEYKDAAEKLAKLEAGSGNEANYIEEADFFRLKEMSIRYDFTSLISDVLPGNVIKGLSFSLAARNIMTITKYSGADVEVNFRGARDLARGQDFLTLPSPRTLYGTLSIIF